MPFSNSPTSSGLPSPFSTVTMAPRLEMQTSPSRSSTCATSNQSGPSGRPSPEAEAEAGGGETTELRSHSQLVPAAEVATRIPPLVR